ncbi:MAG: hypothetical protein V1743_06665 [Nanoarchaeota archaeon]
MGDIMDQMNNEEIVTGLRYLYVVVADLNVCVEYLAKKSPADYEQIKDKLEQIKIVLKNCCVA